MGEETKNYEEQKNDSNFICSVGSRGNGWSRIFKYHKSCEDNGKIAYKKMNIRSS